MSSQPLTLEYLRENNLILVNKNELLNLLAENNVNAAVDKRVKWITRRTAKTKYGVTRHWLNKQMLDVNTLLKVNPGVGKTSTIKYNEQSIIDEQNRLAL